MTKLEWLSGQNRMAGLECRAGSLKVFWSGSAGSGACWSVSCLLSTTTATNYEALIHLWSSPPKSLCGLLSTALLLSRPFLYNWSEVLIRRVLLWSCSVQLYRGIFCSVLLRPCPAQRYCSVQFRWNLIRLVVFWPLMHSSTVVLHMYAYSFIAVLICTALLKSVLHSYTLLCSCSVLMYSCSVVLLCAVLSWFCFMQFYWRPYLHSSIAVCSVQLNCGPDQGSVVATFCTGFYRYNPTHCGHNLYNSVLVLLFTWYNSAAILILSFMFFPRWLLAMELLWDCYRQGRCWIIRTGDWCIANLLWLCPLRFHCGPVLSRTAVVPRFYC